MADQPSALLQLVEVMDRLRSECPWDREQTHTSLAPYLLEETYETLDAIASGDPAELREELGDLLLQVYFHARIAQETPAADGGFDIEAVAAGIAEKLIRRHPHVFADVEAADAATVEANWEQIKATEKQRKSVLDGIPLDLPALALAAKVTTRAARHGLVELPASTLTEEELGDQLMALTQSAVAAGLDPELVLRSRVRADNQHLRNTEAGPT